MRDERGVQALGETLPVSAPRTDAGGRTPSLLPLRREQQELCHCLSSLDEINKFWKWEKS